MIQTNKKLIGTQNTSREILTRIKQITSQFLIGTEMRLSRSFMRFSNSNRVSMGN